MRGKISERGSVLLLEMLIVVSILGVLLVMSAPSFMHLRMSQQASQALSTLRAIQNAEAYYVQIYQVGCTVPGSTTFSLAANPENGQGRSFFVNEFGVIHYSDEGPANSTSPAWFW